MPEADVKPRSILSRFARFLFSAMKFRLSTLLWFTVAVAIFLVWQKDRQQLEQRITRLEQQNFGGYTTGYGANQLLGAPNVNRQGDDAKAWCPANMGSKDWLLLDFDSTIKATAIEVYESYNPGSVVKISTIDWWGREQVIWLGKTGAPVSGKTTINFEKLVAAKRVKVYLDGTKVNGWNEIDTVGLIDRRSKTHWPTRAKTSSSWGGATTDSENAVASIDPRFYSLGTIR